MQKKEIILSKCAQDLLFLLFISTEKSNLDFVERHFFTREKSANI